MICGESGQLYAADSDGSIYLHCHSCGLDVELGTHPSVAVVADVEARHHFDAPPARKGYARELP